MFCNVVVISKRLVFICCRDILLYWVLAKSVILAKNDNFKRMVENEFFVFDADACTKYRDADFQLSHRVERYT